MKMNKNEMKRILGGDVNPEENSAPSIIRRWLCLGSGPGNKNQENQIKNDLFMKMTDGFLRVK